MSRLRVGVLASGSGTNLQELLDSVHGHEAEIVGVASDRADALALTRAVERGVSTEVFPRADHPDREARDTAIADWLVERDVELVVLAGYMAILTPAFVGRFPHAIVNVHPSLLPAFPGIRAIEQALDYGVKVFGVTVHFVDEGVDTGPVILQGSVSLPGALRAAEVLDALRPLEHALLPDAVRLIARGAVRVDGRRTVVDA